MSATIGVGGTLGQAEEEARGVGGARWGAASPRTLGRWLTGALSLLLLFVVAAGAGLGLYASAHADRIYEGVTVAGVPVGGKTRADARAAVERRWAAYAAAPLVLTAGGQTFTVTPDSVGARLDLDASLDAALAYGREGSVWDRSRRWARVLLRPVAVAPRVGLDREAADAQLRGLAPAIVRAPVDARVAMEAAGGPALVPDVPGIALDLAASRAALLERVAAVGEAPVALVTHSLPAAVPAATLEPRLAAARGAVDAPLVLSTAEGIWHVDNADLKRIVAVDPATAELRVAREPLVGVVEELAAEIDRPASDAALTVRDDGMLAVVPAVEAATVDVDATVDAIAAALLAGGDRVDLVVARADPRITDDLAAAAVERGEGLIGRGMVLTWSGGRAELGRGDLLRALTITSRPGEREPFVFGLDRAVVGELLAPVAAEFDRPPVDARFRIVDGRIAAVAEAKAGRALDLEQGVEAVVAAFGRPDPAAKLAVEEIEPKWTAADVDTIALGDEIIAEASTPYGTSSPPRRQNVERAVELQHAWLVPPGGIFSYVENVGAVDAENGFVTGFGIIADESGAIRTAPVIGGGICQVSTTIYQAAFWAGLEIVERAQHPYYLRSYGEAPRGLPGLDAMVNIEPDWAIDLKLRNTTDNWIAILVTGDGQNVTAKVVGTNPGWEVRASPPKITNLVRKDTAMHYSESSELPKGQELLVESAEDGFDVTIDRQVIKNGKVIDEYSVSSSFAPARNLTLRGTGE